MGKNKGGYAQLEKVVTKSAPKSLYFIIIAALVAMYLYAVFFDFPAPEKTVQNYYTAYFNKDYDNVAGNLSVFWAVESLPQYHDMSPAELIQNRALIEKDFSVFIAEIEKDTQYPQDLHIEIEPSYTKMGNNCAFVGYLFKEKDQELGMGVALLLREKGAFRIYDMAPVPLEYLETVTEEDMQQLDADFQRLLEN